MANRLRLACDACPASLGQGRPAGRPDEPCWRSLWLPSRCRQPGLTLADGACPASLGQGRPAGPPVSHVGGRYGCRAVAGNQASPRPVLPVQPALGKADQQACQVTMLVVALVAEPLLATRPHPGLWCLSSQPWARPTSRPTKWAMLAVGVPSMSKKPSTSQTSMKPIRAGGMARPQSGFSLVRSQL